MTALNVPEVSNNDAKITKSSSTISFGNDENKRIGTENDASILESSSGSTKHRQVTPEIESLPNYKDNLSAEQYQINKKVKIMLINYTQGLYVRFSLLYMLYYCSLL